ncbi:MAG: tRNA (N(6)-L-threonylcarbamoyladenosine(37)-C(2))-methylthiotransferase MtaB [Ruminococcaceae bacterium]|nr:tRNA (N(6)-L-threonylcarbamoyladenosine(37)-C(2))-methylthiotransferase MtaB [Oscillospiraceae bacterium]
MLQLSTEQKRYGKVMKKTVGIYTLGCKVNQYESEAIAERFESEGFAIISPTLKCDIYVINTCTVTAESDRKARQFIRRAVKTNPDALILVTGCMAQSRGEQASSIDGVDYICGSSNKLSVVDVAKKLLKSGKNTTPEINIPNIKSSVFEKMSIKKFERTRAYLKIEDGCENRCTYCAIPDARGPVRSKPEEEILCEVRRLTENGCREIVLTGIETASYGQDMEHTDLATLLCEIDKIEGIGRIRIGSIHPSVMNEAFVKRISQVKCLAPHFHLSMQSGSNRILSLMGRKYDRETALHNIELLRKNINGVMLTTDFIVGFPTETDEDFELTMDFARKARFLDMHVFAYSKRSGTPAATMKGQVPENIKKERSAALIALGKELTREALKKFAAENSEMDVLFETYEDGFAYGHTASFVPVAVRSDRPLHAELLCVRVKGTDGEKILGELIERN